MISQDAVHKVSRPMPMCRLLLEDLSAYDKLYNKVILGVPQMICSASSIQHQACWEFLLSIFIINIIIIINKIISVTTFSYQF